MREIGSAKSHRWALIESDPVVSAVDCIYALFCCKHTHIRIHTTHVLLIRTHSEQQQQQQHTGASVPGYIAKLDNGIWSDTRRSLSRVDVCFMHCEYMRYWKVFFVLWFAQAFWGQLHAAWQYCMNTTSSIVGTGSGIRSVTYSKGHYFGLDNVFFQYSKVTTTIKSKSNLNPILNSA